MNMTRRLSKKCLWTATVALLLPGCLGEPGPEEEQPGEVSQALDPWGYEVGWHAGTDFWGLYPVPAWVDYVGCGDMDNGVVRGWHLNEVNANDFRWSEVLCRTMDIDGMQAAPSGADLHFWNAGSGTVSLSAAPSTDLAVGVRLRYAPMDWTVKDVAILHDEADDIYDGSTTPDQAAWAFGRAGFTTDLICDPGEILTGITVNHEDGGSDRDEITSVEVSCHNLDRVPRPR